MTFPAHRRFAVAGEEAGALELAADADASRRAHALLAPRFVAHRKGASA